MSSDRREFLRRSTAAAVALAVPQPAAMPTPRARAFMQAFGLKYPIANAGMGGPAIPELAIAVSNAGGLGAIGSAGPARSNAELMKQRVTQTRAGTSRPFVVNFLLAFDPVTLPVALDAGAPIIQFAFGQPSAEMAAGIRKAGARMGVQISSADGARRAIDLGADYVICQGTEAGGHVQATDPLEDVLAGVIEAAGRVPVLAAGGISTGAHIRRVLLAGASGVLMGTRFVATRESNAHDEYRAALSRARAGDTVLTVCFQDGWVNAPHRVLRNETFRRWEAAGSPPPGKRPGEGDVLATNAVTGARKMRYSTSSPARGDEGTLGDLVLYAGRGVDGIRDVPGAGELVERLWKECLGAA
jgi:nitronate monooxygenase